MLGEFHRAAALGRRVDTRHEALDRLSGHEFEAGETIEDRWVKGSERARQIWTGLRVEGAVTVGGGRPEWGQRLGRGKP